MHKCQHRNKDSMKKKPTSKNTNLCFSNKSDTEGYSDRKFKIRTTAVFKELKDQEMDAVRRSVSDMREDFNS